MTACSTLSRVGSRGGDVFGCTVVLQRIQIQQQTSITIPRREHGMGDLRHGEVSKRVLELPRAAHRGYP